MKQEICKTINILKEQIIILDEMRNNVDKFGKQYYDLTGEIRGFENAIKIIETQVENTKTNSQSLDLPQQEEDMSKSIKQEQENNTAHAQALTSSSNTSSVDSTPISQQLQEWYVNNILQQNTVDPSFEFEEIIQQVKELEQVSLENIKIMDNLKRENDNLWQKLSENDEEITKLFKLLKQYVDEKSARNKQLEEFKKELQIRIGHYKIKENANKIAELYVILELADKYFGKK